MEKIFLIKYGEISLKGENRSHFTDLLRNNIKRKLKGLPTVITHKPGRFYLEYAAEESERIAGALRATFGIVSFAAAWKTEKSMPAIEAAACELAAGLVKNRLGCKFRIECRRTDKKFARNSYEISCCLGSLILANHPELAVNLNHPDWVINVEIREKAYLYGPEEKGLGGLPVGCAGRGLLLLSGGIDSPVAGYLMGKRGLDIDAIYFHTPPFTSEKTLEKVKKLGQLLSCYFNTFKLYIVPFSDLQLKIKETAAHNEVTLHSRAAMMRIAGKIATTGGQVCLITGESLSQVASQTAQSIRYTQSTTDLPVFRPLIGFDKEEIVTLARKIATFETSILPHPDCCTLFAPAHPLIKPDFVKICQAAEQLALGSLVAKAVEDTVCIQI